MSVNEVASDDEHLNLDLFQEPKDFYKPEPEATFATHRCLDGTELKVRLVGHNPLWGHFLWNAGRTISHHLEENAQTLLRERSVLELGAGAGLPGLVAALFGAARVVITDYPDVDLIENISYNIQHSLPELNLSGAFAEGYLWGAAPEKVTQHLNHSADGFDVLILADLLFNHSEHRKLITSVEQLLKRSSSSTALVFFTPYRPWLLEKDLSFFDLAGAAGFKVEKVLEKVMDKVMFDKDPGDELLRRTVYGYALTWSDV